MHKNHDDPSTSMVIQLVTYNYAYEYKDSKMRLQSKDGKILMSIELKDEH